MLMTQFKADEQALYKKHLISLIGKLRKEIPQIAIRTSLIVGFPGEGEKEFEELLDFVKEVKFDRLGVFVYSREEETKASSFKNQVPEREKKDALIFLMKAQQKIAQELNSRFMQKEMEVLIDEEGVDKAGQKKENIYLGRTYADAPEVDGMVYVHSLKKHLPGEFVKVKIVDTLEYDLVGKEI
jgi:2-methylthioadenine synthetase